MCRILRKLWPTVRLELCEMKKLKVWIETGYAHGYHEVEVELDENLSKDEIEKYAHEVMHEQLVEWGWEVVEE